MHVIVSTWDQDGRSLKYLEFETEVEADAALPGVQADWPNAFVAADPGGGWASWKVDAGALVSDPVPPVIGAALVIEERERRLGLGFSYDFGDARGTHVIGTTEQDMKGWNEVTALAQARIATADLTPIDIATDTGAAAVLPLEWMAVLKAAGEFRQPIWAGSFALMAMNPIPADYATNESYWS